MQPEYSEKTTHLWRLGIELTSVVISDMYIIDWCKSDYHKIAIMAAILDHKIANMAAILDYVLCVLAGICHISKYIVPITTNVVSLNPAQAKFTQYNIMW
jgi:hypothetical protein